MARATIRNFEPDYRVHPGEVVEEYLDALSVDVDGLAALVGIPSEEMRGLIDGDASVTPELAGRLGTALGVEPCLWTNMQKAFDDHPERAWTGRTNR